VSTAARKARKSAGVKFEKAQKTPTPFEERSSVVGLVPGPVGTKHETRFQPRSSKKVRRMYEARGIERAS
jgi:hypothetical protein